MKGIIMKLLFFPSCVILLPYKLGSEHGSGNNNFNHQVCTNNALEVLHNVSVSKNSFYMGHSIFFFLILDMQNSRKSPNASIM
jgi:hypothetical protein